MIHKSLHMHEETCTYTSHTHIHMHLLTCKIHIHNNKWKKKTIVLTFILYPDSRITGNQQPFSLSFKNKAWLTDLDSAKRQATASSGTTEVKVVSP